VKNLASQGLNADVIAAKVGLNKNTLRAEHALDLHAGREIRAAEQAAEVVITKEEYYFLDAASLSFSEPGWFEPDCGNLLFLGPNGEAARNLADAFAGWKAEGGRFITAGLSGKFNQKKYAAFAGVVSDYRQKLKLQGDNAPLPRRRTRAPIFEEEDQC
jgi:hypothetical protein